MRRSRFTTVAAAAAALALMVGVGAALAAGGNGSLKQEAAAITDRATFDAAVAKSLGTTTAKLRAAVKAAATARIDAALAADEITSDEAATLTDALADGSFPAVRLATAAGVAKELGTTEAKLNAAYADAQKAQAKARVDQAVTDGKITEAYATELKAQIDAATFPGFGAGPGGGGTVTARVARGSASASACRPRQGAARAARARRECARRRSRSRSRGHIRHGEGGAAAPLSRGGTSVERVERASVRWDPSATCCQT